MNYLRLRDPALADPFDMSFIRRFFPPTTAEAEAPSLSMRIDVKENDKAYTVKADIPGVRKEDINVRVDGNVVQIDAEARSDKEEKSGDRVLRSERYYGAISRTFSLANDVDDAQVDAKYADGVLTLTLPKKATAAAKKITVQ